jgi:cation:H+ antiporter
MHCLRIYESACGPSIPETAAGRPRWGETGDVDVLVSVVLVAGGAAAIVWGAELFAEHLSVAAARLGVSSFALALLLAGAEPEELVTAVTASLRDAPGVAFGDVIGANVTISLVALGAAAFLAIVPFGAGVRPYALGGLLVGAVGGAVIWDGSVGRPAGALLVGLYVAFVTAIWWRERRPPSLGEAAELDEALAAVGSGTTRSRLGRELWLALIGVGALAAGSVAIVEAVLRVTSLEESQTAWGLTVVGFATAAELIVLAWSSARRGMPETVVAAVVGSFAYNASMTLGAAAVARPIRLADPALIRGPWLAMLGSLALVLALSWRRRELTRTHAGVMLALYPVFIAAVALR